jgi:hypothetical protein
MKNLVHQIKVSVEDFLVELGNIVLFTLNTTKQFFIAPFEFKELVKQGYIIGNKTFPLIAITGFNASVEAGFGRFWGTVDVARNDCHFNHQGNWAGDNSIALRRENKFRNWGRAGRNESNRTT